MHVALGMTVIAATLATLGLIAVLTGAASRDARKVAIKAGRG